MEPTLDWHVAYYIYCEKIYNYGFKQMDPIFGYGVTRCHVNFPQALMSMEEMPKSKRIFKENLRRNS